MSHPALGSSNKTVKHFKSSLSNGYSEMADLSLYVQELISRLPNASCEVQISLNVLRHHSPRVVVKFKDETSFGLFGKNKRTNVLAVLTLTYDSIGMTEETFKDEFGGRLHEID